MITQRDLDKTNARSDYIAMMMGIDIDAMSFDTQNKESDKYTKVEYYYLKELWGIVALRNAIGRWISRDQYNAIIKKKEKIDSSIDTSNKIPEITI